jgi:hypothetical protein
MAVFYTLRLQNVSHGLRLDSSGTSMPRKPLHFLISYLFVGTLCLIKLHQYSRHNCHNDRETARVTGEA